jgi:PAS domain S-box-containing protein
LPRWRLTAGLGLGLIGLGVVGTVVRLGTPRSLAIGAASDGSLARWVAALGCGLALAALATALALTRRSLEAARQTEAGLVDAQERLASRIRASSAELGRANEAVVASEARLAGIVSSASDAIIAVDIHQRILLMNEAAERIFGVAAATLLGQRVERLIPERFRGDHDRHVAAFIASGVTRRAVNGSAVVLGLRGDGTEVPLEASVSRDVHAGESTFTVILRDVTARLRADAERSRLAAIVESSSDAIVGKTLDGVITSWNHAAEALFGYRAAEVLGGPLLRLFPDDRVSEEAEILARLARGEVVTNFETQRLTKDGRRIDVSVTISPIREADGRISGASKIARDVTAVKSAERALRASELRFATMFHGSPLAIMIAQVPEGRLEDVNDAFVRIFGRPREALIGRSVTELGTWADLAQRARLVQALVDHGRVFLEEVRLRTAAGASLCLQVSAEVVQLDGEPHLYAMIADLTERKKTEAALRANQALLDEMGRIAKIGGWDFDPVTGAGHWTDEVARIHELDPALPINAAEGIRYYTGESRPRIEAAVREAIERATPYDLELEILTAKGNRRWIRTIGHPVVEDGKVVLVRGSFQDISERRGAEAARRSSEARLRLFVEHAPAALAMLDRDLRYVTVSRRWLDDFHLGSRDLRGLHHYDVFPGVPERWKAVHRRGLAGEVVSAARDPFERADGTLQWLRWEVRPWHETEGEVGGILIFSEDVSASVEAEASLRESELRFRQIAENIDEVFWMADPEAGKVLYVSPAFERIYGRSGASILAKRETWLEAIHPEDRERVRAAARGQERGDYDETYRIVRPDGSARWVHDRASPVRDASGRVIRIVGVAEDVTERRQLEAQLGQAQKLEAIGTLAGGIAHDFNNILGAILGFSELALLGMTKGSRPRDYVVAVTEAAERARKLVAQILAFSRKKEERLEPLDLAAAVVEPLQLLRATIPSSIELRQDLPAGLPWVLSDVTRVHQLIMNLGTNAWHAMRDRPGVLEVRLAAVAVDDALAATNPRLHVGPYVRLTFRDTGCGMTRATLERAFEPFFTTKPPGEGTGLGLSVVHGIVESHGGAIAVESEPGAGTTFELYFPTGTRERVTPRPVPRDPGRGRGERVLFVDDEPNLAVLARAMCDELGYRGDVRTDPREALACVRADPASVDVVVSDLTMPGMSGLELARQLRLIRPELPIVLTTGDAAGLTPESLRSLGVRQLLRKPFSLRSLAEALAAALAR